MRGGVDVKGYAFIGLGIVTLFLAFHFFSLSVRFMLEARVATSALAALIGFTFVAASLQLFRLGAVVRALREESVGRREGEG